MAKLVCEHTSTEAEEERTLKKAMEDREAKDDEANRKKHERAKRDIQEMRNMLIMQKTEKEKQRYVRHFGDKSSICHQFD